MVTVSRGGLWSSPSHTLSEIGGVVVRFHQLGFCGAVTPQPGQVALIGRPLVIPAHDVAPNRNGWFDSDCGSLELEVIMIEYFRSLDAALLAFAETADLSEYLAHCERWNVGMADSADRQLVTAHKCITARVTMPQHHRERSRQWLVDRGYQPFG